MRVGQQLCLLVNGKVGVDLFRPAVVEGLQLHGSQPLLKALGGERLVSRGVRGVKKSHRVSYVLQSVVGYSKESSLSHNLAAYSGML